MSKAIDLTGKRYGRLTVIKQAGRAKNGNMRWLCRCDCGNSKVVDGYNLRSGQSESCGCLRKEKSKQSIQNNPQTKVYIGNASVLKKTWHPTSHDLRSSNKSGVTGVSFDQCQQRWVARLYFHGRYVLNRMYVHKEHAIAARRQAEELYLKTKL